MRRALLALSLFAAPLVLGGAPAAHAAGPALVVNYYKDHTLANGGSLHAGTSDNSFEFFLILSSEGDSTLDIGTITVPAGFSFVGLGPSNTSVPAGATASLQLSCDSTTSGTLTIPSNDPSGPFTATLSCSLDGNGAPTMEVRTGANVLIPNGTGSLSLPSGGITLLWIYNTGADSAGLDLSPASAAPAGVGLNNYYVPEADVPSGGTPSYLGVSCLTPQLNAGVTGDFVISIPIGATGGSYTFTLRCTNSLADTPTGSGLTLWGSTLAALLLAMGAGLWMTSRRGATAR